MHAPVAPRLFTVGVPVLVLTVGICFAALHGATGPASTSAAHAFAPWPVTWERPAVLGLVIGFATDRAGNLFVGTNDPAPSRTGIWKLAPTGQVLGHWNSYGRSIIHSDDIAVDPRGNAYVVDAGANRVYKLSPGGRWIAAWGSTGTGPGQFTRSTSIAADSQGHVLVGDSTGRIQRFSSTGKLQSVWSNCGVHQSARCLPLDMATDSHSNVYVTDGTPFYSNVRKLSPSGGLLAHWTSTGESPSQPLFFPDEVSADPRGNGLVADSFSGGVYRLPPKGRPVRWLQVTPRDGYHAFALALDSQGNVYVNDCCLNTIVKFSADGIPAPNWAAFDSVPVPLPNPSGIAVNGHGGIVVVSADRPAAVHAISPAGHAVRAWPADSLGQGQAHAPVGVALGASGQVYVIDALTDRVVKLSPSGAALRSWGTPSGGRGELTAPSAAAVDPGGNLYVTDTGNYRVVKFSPTGKPFQHWGESVSFARARGVALDAFGNVYVADSGTHTIDKLSKTGRLLTRWSGTGSESLIAPAGVAVDGGGNVFVTDTGDSRVKEFSSSGKPIASWGKRGTHSGEFVEPGGIAVDRAGVVWVADTGNNRIQRLPAR